MVLYSCGSQEAREKLWGCCGWKTGLKESVYSYLGGPGTCEPGKCYANTNERCCQCGEFHFSKFMPDAIETPEACACSQTLLELDSQECYDWCKENKQGVFYEAYSAPAPQPSQPEIQIVESEIVLESEPEPVYQQEMKFPLVGMLGVIGVAAVAIYILKK